MRTAGAGHHAAPPAIENFPLPKGHANVPRTEALVLMVIMFENVSFKYPNRDECALKNVTLHIAVLGTER